MDLVVTDAAKNQLVSIMNTDPTERMYLVYGHCCNVNNKWYIGETSLIDNPLSRFGGEIGWMYTRKERKSDGTYKYKHPKFAAAIKKYGWENFSHYILGYYTDAEIDNGEIYWITEKDSLNNGYNSTLGGLHGHSLTEENKSRISNPVVMYNLKTNETIEVFASIKEAAGCINGKNSDICECCQGNRKSYRKFGFRYLNGRSIRTSNKKRSSKVLAQAETEKRVARPVLKIDLNTGEILNRYESSEAAAISEGICASLISRCCRHERYSTHGYRWEFGGNYNV